MIIDVITLTRKCMLRKSQMYIAEDILIQKLYLFPAALTVAITEVFKKSKMVALTYNSFFFLFLQNGQLDLESHFLQL